MANILSAIQSMIQAVTGWIVSTFTSVSEIFYDTSGTTPQFTFVGVLLLVAFGLGLVWVLINFIKSLVKRG